MLLEPQVGAAADQEYRELADLVRAVREVMTAASTSGVDAHVMTEQAAELRRIAAVLGAKPVPERIHKIRLLPQEMARVRAGEPWQCFPFNVQGIPFAMTVTGQSARAEFTPGPLQEGPPAMMHGGFSAAMIDAFLGTLVQVGVEPAFTATLDLRFLGPIHLGVPCVLEGAITHRSGRKSVAECTISQHGVPLVEAKAIFVAVMGSGHASVEAKIAELS